MQAFSITKPKIRHPENSIMMRRRGRESNPRIAVLQTATLPLGYPAGIEREMSVSLVHSVSTWQCAVRNPKDVIEVME